MDVMLLILGLPLLMIAVVFCAWLDFVCGSSPPGRGDLEHLLMLKHHGGFARMARRIRENRAQISRSKPAIPAELESMDLLARLAVVKNRMFADQGCAGQL
jgi:hypothetical protein